MYLRFEFVAEFITLAKYTRELKFEEEPNYSSIQELIEAILARNKYMCDFVFDWSQENSNRSKSILSPDEKSLEKIRKDIR